MRALVIGGTGKTGSAVARGLRERGAAARIASRQPRAPDQVRFDWADPDSHDSALRDVDAVYLVAPALVRDPAELMLPFITRARAHGVGSLVLLSSSAIEAGAPGLGAVHAALRAGPPGWTVLRPSWFMQNFADPQHAIGHGILDERSFVTASGRGRVGFVDARDIAAVAVATLFAPADAALVLTGPEALSYDEAAVIVSEALGERVTHHAIAVDEWCARLVAAGMPTDYAAMLGALELAIAAGAEDRTTDEVLRRTGRPPRSLREFARAAFARA